MRTDSRNGQHGDRPQQDRRIRWRDIDDNRAQRRSGHHYEGKADRGADADQSQDVPHDQPQNPFAIRPDGDPSGDVARPGRHGVRHDTVDADGDQREADDGHEGHDAHCTAPLERRIVAHVVEGADEIHRLIAVESGNRRADRRQDDGRRTDRPDVEKDLVPSPGPISTVT